MKREFDIHSYRELEEDYNKKLIFVNSCICKARVISSKEAVNELKYIRLQIYEYCTITEIKVPENIPTGRQMLKVTDAAIINYVNEKITYFSGLDELNVLTNQNPAKPLPSLPDCFVDPSFWDSLMKNPRIMDYYEKMGNGEYRWKGAKNLLSGFAWRLLNKGKFKEYINSGSQLEIIFCKYFNVPIENDHRTFRPDRAKTDSFHWIN